MVRVGRLVGETGEVGGEGAFHGGGLRWRGRAYVNWWMRGSMG